MQENTNKSIAVNSLILYIRLAIISISGLLYTRFSLQALGISDYGLYSVIACIIIICRYKHILAFRSLYSVYCILFICTANTYIYSI